MLTLRIILGAILILFSGSYFVLATVARGFRQSFGASPMSILMVILPLAAMALLLASLIFPTQRILLHIAAAMAVGLVGFCLWLMITEKAGILVVALAFLAAWFVFYWHAVRMTGPIGS